MKYFKINKIIKNKNIIKYEYEYSKELAKYFNENDKFFIEYIAEPKINTEEIPDSVAVIPLLGNVLPIIWICNANLYVDELDKTFYDRLEYIKSGYKKIWKKLKFRGKITVNKVISNNSDKIGAPVSFFSMGADAWQTLISHYKEKPILMTMFGADIDANNIESIKDFKQKVNQTAQDFNLNTVFFKTNLKSFITGRVEKLIKPLRNIWGGGGEVGWWHEIQHSLGVITHAAPIAYLNHSRFIYFASTNSSKDIIKKPLASVPEIDNEIRFIDAQVVHDGYEFQRQDKIHNICEFSQNHNYKINLHVCWESQNNNNSNCNICEKCLRTIIGIIIEGYDPNEFGFIYDKEKTQNDLKKIFLQDNFSTLFAYKYWLSMQKKFINSPNLQTDYPELNWFVTFDFNQQRKKIILKNILRKLYSVQKINNSKKKKYTILFLKFKI